MPTRRTQINTNTLPASNVISISSPGQQVDFCKESVQVRIYFDGETTPSVDEDITTLIVANNQPHCFSTQVPVYGDHAVVEITSQNEHILELIVASPMYVDPLSHGEIEILTDVIQRFAQSVDINRLWNVRFRKHEELLSMIRAQSPAHYDVLNSWLTWYETLSTLRSDEKLKKQERNSWEIRYRDAELNYTASVVKLGEFCRRNNIPVMLQ